MTKDEATAVAERIVARLFTNGQAEEAERLVLTVDGPPKRDLGGWGRLGARDQIVAVLLEMQTEEGR